MKKVTNVLDQLLFLVPMFRAKAEMFAGFGYDLENELKKVGFNSTVEHKILNI